MSHLDRIIAQKRIEVENLAHVPFPLAYYRKPNVPTFYEKAKAHKGLAVISEIKKASPSKGDLNVTVDVVAQAKLYAENGASAISVLTDETFFKGSMNDLRQVRQAVDVPILCKDFMISTAQIDVAYHSGANLILLIVAALTDEELRSLNDYALSKELEVLIEVHNIEELERALLLSPKLLGINNRNLLTFEENLETTKQLIARIEQSDAILISESGIRSIEDAQTVAGFGADAILVGEALMRSEQPGQLLRDFQDVKGSTV
ncbi:MAG: indole-3-glycerol phosphate synthase TrpC [Bacilli bacterium]